MPLPERRDLRLQLLRLESQQPWRDPQPELGFLNHHLLPRRVADEDVEASVVTEEHLREQRRHVCGLERFEDRLGFISCGETGDRVRVGACDESLSPDPGQDRGVEQQPGGRGLLAGLGDGLRRCSGLGPVDLVGVGDVDEHVAGPFECLDDRPVEQRHRTVPVGHQGVERFFDAADAGETVGAHQVVVEAAHREAPHEGVDPDRHPGELHGDRVDVEAVDAASGDLSAEQRGTVRGGDLRAGRFDRGLPEAHQFGFDAGDGVLFEERRHGLLEMVDRGGEEVARAHRQVGDTEVEEQLTGARLVACVEQVGDIGEVLVECRDERALQQVLNHERRREVRAGALALAAGVVEVDVTGPGPDVVAAASRHPRVVIIQGQVDLGEPETGLQQSLVDGAELPHAERPEVDGCELVVVAVVEHQVLQHRAHHVVRDPDRVDALTERVQVVTGEQSAVVRRHPPRLVALVDDPPHLYEVVPETRGLGVELLVRVVGQVLGDRLEGVAVVLGVLAERQQPAVLGVHLEQQTEEDPQRHLVGGIETLGVELEAVR